MCNQAIETPVVASLTELINSYSTVVELVKGITFHKPILYLLLRMDW